jgi:hypothetical protein
MSLFSLGFGSYELLIFWGMARLLANAFLSLPRKKRTGPDNPDKPDTL